MKIFPAIDLLDGACVRLYKGEFSEKTVYTDEPLAMARLFQEKGAEWLHVVDLDGARAGRPMQSSLIDALCAGTELTLQVGGGIHRLEHVTRLLDAGVGRVVIGSRAVHAREEVGAWLERFGPERIVCAFDVRIDEGTPTPATRGWQDRGTRSLWDILDGYREFGLRHVLCTDIERDGTLEGPNFELYREIGSRHPEISLLASGGVRSLDDIRELQKMEIPGVVIGKAIYEGKLSLSEALDC